MTNLKLLEFGIEKLKEAGIDDAGTDARILFEYVTGLDRNALLIYGSDEIREGNTATGSGADDGKAKAGSGKDGLSVKDVYDSLITERAGRKPVQYITGMADFMGLRFKVNENVLIPRFDTEFLVEEVMKEVDDGSSILDMCTGSGCIILSLMKYKNGIKGTGADISEPALDIARMNENAIFGTRAGEGDEPGYDKHDRVEWVLSDMFENITGEYDCIVSNPPYIRSDVIETLMPEVRDHEPYKALDGDADGLKYYRIIAKEAGGHLKRYGRLFLEIGYDEGTEVALILERSGFSDIQVMKDYSGNDRVVKAVNR